MNTENLRLFCRVMEEGNVSKAARLEYVTQPAVTKQIRQLEDRYGTLLFDRQDGKLIPKKTGETLYPFAKEMLETLDQSHGAIKEVNGEHDLALHIGASFTIGDYLLPNIMGQFKKTFPQYQFSLTIGNTPQMLEKLQSQAIDIALVESQVDDDSLSAEVFAQDELILVIPAGHPWQNKQTIMLQELTKEKMIWRESESGTRIILEKALRDAGVLDKIHSSLELGSIQSIKSAVEAGLGISILPTLTVKKELQSGTLKTITMKDLTCTRNLLIVQKPERFKKSLIHRFASFVRQIHD